MSPFSQSLFRTRSFFERILGYETRRRYSRERASQSSFNFQATGLNFRRPAPPSIIIHAIASATALGRATLRTCGGLHHSFADARAAQEAPRNVRSECSPPSLSLPDSSSCYHHRGSSRFLDLSEARSGLYRRRFLRRNPRFSRIFQALQDSLHNIPDYYEFPALPHRLFCKLQRNFVQIRERKHTSVKLVKHVHIFERS